MDKMEIYNNLRKPPATALKKIKGGRLSGLTDINPQWRYEALTEQFGPCGIGWKFEIVRLWVEQGSDGQMMALAHINLFHSGPEWSEPIPGIGGSMLVANETRGPYTSDEAFKMAITDALSTAAKLIGVGGDIYAGKWDGIKYIGESQGTVTPDQARELEALIADTNSDVDKFLKFAGSKTFEGIPAANYQKCKSALESKLNKTA